MIILYSAGIFIRINKTCDMKYMPISWAKTKTIMFDDFDEEIL